MVQSGHAPLPHNPAIGYGGPGQVMEDVAFMGDPRRVLGHPSNPATEMVDAYVAGLGSHGDVVTPPLADPGSASEMPQGETDRRSGQWRYTSEFLQGSHEEIPESSRLPEDHPVRAHLTALGIDGEPVASMAMGHEKRPEWFAVVDISAVPRYHEAGHAAYLAPFAKPAIVQNDSPEIFPLPEGDAPSLMVIHFEPNGKVATRLLPPEGQMLFGRGDEVREHDPESASFHYGDNHSMSRLHGRMIRSNGLLYFSDEGSKFGSQVDFAYFDEQESSYDQADEAETGNQPAAGAAGAEGALQEQAEELPRPEEARIPGTYRLDAAGVERISEVLHDGLHPNDVLLGATPHESLHAMRVADAMLDLMKDAIRHDHGALLALQGRNGAIQNMLDTAGRMYLHWTGHYPERLRELEAATEKTALQHVYEQLQFIQETVRNTSWDGTHRTSRSADGSTAADRMYIAFNVADGLQAIASQRESVNVGIEPADRLIEQFPKQPSRHARTA